MYMEKKWDTRTDSPDEVMARNGGTYGYVATGSMPANYEIKHNHLCMV